MLNDLIASNFSGTPDLQRFKVAFIGSHGVGKTTMCYGLAGRLKARDVSLDVVREVARRCPLPINEETGLAAQAWILHTQIAEELVAQERYPVVLSDRSILDNYVYLLLAKGEQPGLESLVNNWMATYDLLIHVPIVDLPAADGIRATDPQFQLAIDERLGLEISARGLVTHQLDPAAREGWLDQVESLVFDFVKPAQLPLL
jgi:nicotinamide riboside kinase